MEKLLCEDVVKYAGEFVRLGRNSRLLRERVSTDSLQRYANAFIKMLGTVYSNLRESRSGVLNGLAFQAFCFGESSQIEWSDRWRQALEEVVYQNRGGALRTVRVLRFYEQNTMILVKLDRLRYWIPSTAIEMLTETLADLQKQGY